MHAAAPPLSADISTAVAFVLIKACFKYPKPGRMCGQFFTKSTQLERKKKNTSLLEKVPINTQKEVIFLKPEGQKVTCLAARTVRCHHLPLKLVSAGFFARVLGDKFFPVSMRRADNAPKREEEGEKEINKHSPEQSSSLDIGKHSINQYNGEYKACLRRCGALLQVAEDL